MRRAHGREHFARTISNVSLTATSGRARSPLKDEPVEGEKKGDREGKKRRRRRVEEEEKERKKGGGKRVRRNCWTLV